VLRASRLSDDLRESEERMHLAAEAANLGMWLWDVVKDEVWMTDKGRALFGIGPDTRVDFATLSAGVHPKDRAARAAAIERLHMQLRKVLKARGHFLSDEAATKLMKRLPCSSFSEMRFLEANG
jgi:PAS domain-containing protein